MIFRGLLQCLNKVPTEYVLPSSEQGNLRSVGARFESRSEQIYPDGGFRIFLQFSEKINTFIWDRTAFCYILLVNYSL
jgi:hypothetical protein